VEPKDSLAFVSVCPYSDLTQDTLPGTFLAWRNVLVLGTAIKGAVLYGKVILLELEGFLRNVPLFSSDAELPCSHQQDLLHGFEGSTYVLVKFHQLFSGS